MTKSAFFPKIVLFYSISGKNYAKSAFFKRLWTLPWNSRLHIDPFEPSILSYRRKFTICPLLEGEENLRLLNLQHNLIKKIQHLQTLKKLIFLDLYDNQIEEISGLNGLSSLRVLMLGKNRFVTKYFQLFYSHKAVMYL